MGSVDDRYEYVKKGTTICGMAGAAGKILKGLAGQREITTDMISSE